MREATSQKAAYIDLENKISDHESKEAETEGGGGYSHDPHQNDLGYAASSSTTRPTLEIGLKGGLLGTNSNGWATRNRNCKKK